MPPTSIKRMIQRIGRPPLDFLRGLNGVGVLIEVVWSSSSSVNSKSGSGWRAKRRVQLKGFSIDARFPTSAAIDHLLLNNSILRALICENTYHHHLVVSILLRICTSDGRGTAGIRVDALAQSIRSMGRSFTPSWQVGDGRARLIDREEVCRESCIWWAQFGRMSAR